ncbi:MAG: tRNA pseudouridine38-40 synthase [Granulosicoccus sp.]|jgi:tRNA pseudouridine38-40 synthase
MVLKRIALAVEYDGQGFCGWQRQPHCHSVQAEVEQALSKIAQHAVTVYCAGRTDTGVHAAAQVVHFESEAERPLRAWTFGTNSHLDKRVSIHWASEMPMSFHARFSALDRSYRYTILNRATRPGYQAGTMGWERTLLNAERMHAAAQVLVGEHDFSSFRSADCQANHAVRTLKRITVRRDLDKIIVEVTANGFLHNMVRIVTGCLLTIGRGDRPEDWMSTLLGVRDRSQAGMTIAPRGLCFLQPSYPHEYGVPDFEKNKEIPWYP